MDNKFNKVSTKSTQILNIIKEFKSRLNKTVYNPTCAWVTPEGTKVSIKNMETSELKQILWNYGIVLHI